MDTKEFLSLEGVRGIRTEYGRYLCKKVGGQWKVTTGKDVEAGEIIFLREFKDVELTEGELRKA